MEKRKNELVSKEMRERLNVNRDGQLTRDQWIDLLLEPSMIGGVIGVAILMLVVIRLPFMRGGLPLLLFIAALALTWYLVTRARRFTRLPVSYGRFFADVRARPWWQFWRPYIFYKENDTPVEFMRWLPPRPILRINGEYMVYFLEDGNQRIILSLAPTNHDEAGTWQPTTLFHERYNKRSGKRIR
jgi:hypothetical protein